MKDEVKKRKAPPEETARPAAPNANLPQVVILVARCQRSRQSFGVRLEEKKRGQWLATWAFALKETAAQREGYDQARISGTFEFAADYPGCPFCQATGLFKCQCEQLACWNLENKSVTCPWCGAAGQVSGKVESLQAGRDR